MLEHEHYHSTIQGNVNIVDLSVTKGEGIKIGTRDQSGGALAVLSTEQATLLLRTLKEIIEIQKIFTEEIVRPELKILPSRKNDES